MAKKKFALVVFSNPVAGKEQEYNDWYTDIHLPDLLRIPGIYAAERLSATDQPAMSPVGHKYLALYHCEADDIASLSAEITKRAGTPDMTLSDALDAAGVSMQMFEVFSEQTAR